MHALARDPALLVFDSFEISLFKSFALPPTGETVVPSSRENLAQRMPAHSPNGLIMRLRDGTDRQVWSGRGKKGVVLQYSSRQTR